MLVERVVEDAFADDRHDPAGPSSHVIVIPTRPAELSWKTGGRNLRSRFSPGEIIVNPRGNFVSPRWSDPTEFLLLGIDSRVLSSHLTEMELPEILLSPRFRFKDELLHQLARALVQNYEGANGPPDPLYADTLGRALAAHLAKCAGVPSIPPVRKPSLPPAKLRLIDDYIHAHLSDEIRLDALASRAGISPSHFVVLFRGSTGMSPHRYVMETRIRLAKHLLLRTTLPIAGIAAQCGFCDQSHLTRVMRRVTGSTPGDFR